MPAALKGVTVATYDATAASFPLAYGLSRDGRLQAPVWNGEPRQAAPATLRTAARPDGGWSFALDIPACVWQDDERLRPAWAFWYADGKEALWPAKPGGRWLGRLWHPLDPRQFGRLLDEP